MHSHDRRHGYLDATSRQAEAQLKPGVQGAWAASFMGTLEVRSYRVVQGIAASRKDVLGYQNDRVHAYNAEARMDGSSLFSLRRVSSECPTSLDVIGSRANGSHVLGRTTNP